MANTSGTKTCSSDLSRGNVILSKKLYETIREKPGNIFYSPTSLSYALALLYVGTEGNTAKQIQSSLKFPENKEILYKDVSASKEGLVSCKNVTLNIADGLFVQENFKIKSSFVDVAKKHFGSLVTSVDFKSEKALQTINEFVSKETKDKIKELFQKDSFDELTRMVIVNAIHFKGDWANKFDPKLTFKGDFHLNKNDKVQVDFMQRKGHFNLGFQSDLEASVVVMPYKDEKLSMVLIVPNDIEGLKRIEEKLPELVLEEIVKETHSQEIILSLPKFRVTQTLKLKDTLCKLGMSDMFSDEADLSGISEEKLKVSDVIQKTFIEVNEEGAEAAAATGMTFMLRAMPIVPEITVNSPFIFFIYDNSVQSILFMGRLSAP